MRPRRGQPFSIQMRVDDSVANAHHSGYGASAARTLGSHRPPREVGTAGRGDRHNRPKPLDKDCC
jgi:hypothetical protein